MLREKLMDMLWEDMKSAPKDGEPFLAWYESQFGPPFGTMKWEPEPKGNGGRFQSMTMGTQTKCATHWMRPDAPKVWGDPVGYRSRLFGNEPAIRPAVDGSGKHEEKK